jgi:hypothetical protein
MWPIKGASSFQFLKIDQKGKMAWRYRARQGILWPSDLENTSGGSNNLHAIRADELH